MKQVLFILLSILYLLPLESSRAQKIKFYHNQLSKAKAKAHKKNKILFVEVYASWCGPCKRMEETVFRDKIAAKFYKKNFISCKIDVESVVGDVFSEQYPIKSIPTLFFFDSNHNLIFKKIGAPNDSKDFIAYGQAAIEIAQHLKENSPIKTPKSLFLYSYYLNEEEKNYHPYLHNFLEQQKDWSTTDAMQIIFDLATEKDSLALDYFLNHIDIFEEKYGKDAVQEKRMMLVLDVVLDFLDNSSKTPNFEEAVPIFQRYFGKENYLEHLLLFKFRYHQQHGQKMEMRSTLEQFVQEVVAIMPDDKEKAIEYIQAAANYYDLSEGQEDLQAIAFRWGEEAARLYQGYEVYSILAVLYQDAGLYEQAKFYQDKANKAKKE